MKKESDYRKIARESLAGRWFTAIIVSAIVVLFSSTISAVRSQVNLDMSGGTYNEAIAQYGAPLQVLINHPAWAGYASLFTVVTAVFSIIHIVNFVIGGSLELGHARFNVRLVNKTEVAATDVFSEMNRLGTGFVYRLLKMVYLILWILAFIIPGIVKTYSYALAPYLLNDYRDLRPNEAITLSRKVMDGKKAKLFVLQLSFIGWSLLASIPASILGVVISRASYETLSNPMFVVAALILTFASWLGDVIVIAYYKASEAAFYCDAISDYNRQNAANGFNYYGGQYGQESNNGGSQYNYSGDVGQNAGKTEYTGSNDGTGNPFETR